ncbi:MAG: DUF2147 domain-containing protein [Devosia sp.]
MTRTLKWLAAIGLATLSVSPALAATASPIGSWQVNSGEARYKVTACGGGLCAKLVWLSPEAQTAENLALLNKYVVRGAQPVSATEWAGDVTFDGNSYAGKVTLRSKNSMTLKGCSGMLCKTVEFSRI